MITVTNTSVELKPPGSSTWRQVAVNAATIAESAGVIDKVIVSWNRATPRDHPEPGSGSVSILIPQESADNALMQYDAQVRIRATFSDGVTTTAQANLTHSWIESYTRTAIERNRRPYFRYDVDLMDVLGRADATMIGMAPRPQETRDLRYLAINAASKAGPLMTPISTAGPGSVIARDVDNYNALALLRETAGVGRYIMEGDAGLATQVNNETGTAQLLSSEYGLFIHDGFLSGAYRVYGVRIPAAWIVDAPRNMSRTSSVTEVTLELNYQQPPQPAYEETITVKDGPGSFSTSRLVIKSDGLYFPTQQAALTAMAKSIIAESARPVLTLGTTELDLTTADVSIIKLISQGWRDAIVLKIIDAPKDLGAVQIMTGGQLVIRGTKLKIDQVRFAPGNLFGVRPLRFSDCRALTPQRPRFRQSVASQSRSRARFTYTSVVNFAHSMLY